MPSLGKSKSKKEKRGKSKRSRRHQAKLTSSQNDGTAPSPFAVPLIDVGNIEKSKATQDLFFKALTDIGFLVVTNHGIPDELIKKIRYHSTQFYEATHEQRIRFCKDSPTRLMIHEGSGFTDEKYKNSRNDQKIILDVDETDRLYAEYLDLLSELGLNLLSWTEKVLGLQPGRLINQYEPAGTIVDALFYDKTPEGQWGTKRHYDNCMMTILMQDDVGGLELRHKGTWYPVKPIDGTFIINFGKMMEHFSYGVIKATLHRVRNTKDRMRTSWPLFMGPNLNRELIQLIEFKWNEDRFIETENRRIIQENKEIEENAAHVHLHVSENGHHVWEMIPKKSLTKYRELLAIQNSRKLLTKS